MNDKSALLGQLKIDRDGLPQESSAGKWLLIVAVLAGAGAAVIYAFKPVAAVPVKPVSAIAAAGAAGPGSVLDASGYVIARRQAVVSSKVTGKVMELNIEEGRPVKRGEVLARIDDTNARAALNLAQSQLDAARGAVAEVKVQLIEAERQLRRSREMHERKLVSEAALDNAQSSVESLQARMESAQQNATVAERGVSVQRQFLDDTVVRAPFDGVITVKNAQVGEMISPLGAGGGNTRTGIGTLVDMASLEIEVDVNENFINRVQAEQPVTATLNAYPDWKIPAAVIAIIPTADRQKATVKVRIAIKASDSRVLPDMGVRVSFLTEEKTAAAGGQAEAPKGVLIPGEAVKDDSGAKVVFVLKGETVERRAVSLGATRGGDVQVLAGLSSGEQVVLGDLSQLADGTRVKIQK